MEGKVNGQRDLGLDLLRILSMLMIFGMHLLYQGGAFAAAKEGSAVWVTMVVLESLFFSSVNCFALISGYVLCRSRFKMMRVLRFWAQVWFYSVLLTLIRLAIDPSGVTVSEILGSLFPILRGRLWYASSYVGLLFLIPFVNRLLRSMNKRQHLVFLCVLLLLFSVLMTLSVDDPFGINYSGHSTPWLLVLYVVGAYLKCYPPNWTRRQCAWGALIALFLTAASKVCLFWMTRRILGHAQGLGVLVREVSPTVVIIALCLFWIFRGIRVRNAFLQRVIPKFGPLAFAVYAIHLQPLLWDAMRGSFAFLAQHGVLFLLAGNFGLSVLATAVGMAIDLLRQQLFRILHVEAGLLRLAEGLQSLWNRAVGRLLNS